MSYNPFLSRGYVTPPEITGSSPLMVVLSKSNLLRQYRAIPNSPSSLDTTPDRSSSCCWELLGGIRNESFGVLELIIRDKHTGKWLQQQTEHGWGVKVKVTIVQPEGARAGDGLLVLAFSPSVEEPEEEVRCLIVPGTASVLRMDQPSTSSPGTSMVNCFARFLEPEYRQNTA
ncbi:unnamed protein product, partial [Ectocarpus sp. 4 AP-2014]